MVSESKHQSTITTQRLEAFSDGVFAIVITLLFLNLKVPEIKSVEDWRELLNGLYLLLPKFLSIAVSFGFVAIFWVAHHQFFHTLRQTTRALLWINLVFLFMVCFIPFPAAILTEFPNNKTSVVLFGITVFLTGVSLAALRYYAWIKHQEITSLIKDDGQIRKAFHRSVLITLINTIALAVSFFFPLAAIVVYLLAPVTLLFPVKVEIENVEEQSEEETSEVVL